MKKSNSPQYISEFLHPSDFEKAFRPTKWSIRLYLNHLKNLELRAQVSFADHTEDILCHHYKDRDTKRFIEKIRQKAATLNKPGGNYYQTDSDSNKIPVSGNRDAENQIILSMAEIKTKGYISCTWEDLAEFIKNNFEMTYAKTTILSKLYDLNNKARDNFF